jgi:hypothetical protein
VTETRRYLLGGIPDRDPIEVTDISQLDAVLDDLQARFHDDPRLVSIASAEGEQSLSIGLGDDQSTLNWIDEGDADNAYLTRRIGSANLTNTASG